MSVRIDFTTPLEHPWNRRSNGPMFCRRLKHFNLRVTARNDRQLTRRSEFALTKMGWRWLEGICCVLRKLQERACHPHIARGSPIEEELCRCERARMLQAIEALGRAFGLTDLKDAGRTRGSSCLCREVANCRELANLAAGTRGGGSCDEMERTQTREPRLDFRRVSSAILLAFYDQLVSKVLKATDHSIGRCRRSGSYSREIKTSSLVCETSHNPPSQLTKNEL